MQNNIPEFKKNIVLGKHQEHCANILKKSKPRNVSVIVENDDDNTSLESRSANVSTALMATGTGKSFTEFKVILDDIKKNKKGVYLINIPRILLGQQFLFECFNFLSHYGCDANYLLLNSGNQMNDYPFDYVRQYFNHKNGTEFTKKPIKTTTNKNDIVEVINSSEANELPMIIISTYHSMDKVRKGLIEANTRIGYKQLNLVINDEAQYLTHSEFSKCYRNLKPKKEVFFTATSRNSNDSDFGFGMNNKNIFGDVVYTLSPNEAVNLGLMCKPGILHVKSDYDKLYNIEDYDIAIPHIIKTTFESLNDKVNGCGKMLVSVTGTSDITRFMNSDVFDKLRKDDVEILAIATHEDVRCMINGENQINGNFIKRSEWLDHINKIGNDDGKKMIVFHFDILSEGIDVSGFNCFMPLRNLEKDKFLQNCGRCSRLHPLDRHNLFSNKIKPKEFDKMFKPNYWIAISDLILEDKDKRRKLTQLIYDLRGDDFDFSLDYEIDDKRNGGGSQEDEDVHLILKSDELIQDLKFIYDDLTKGLLSEQIEKSFFNNRFNKI